MKIDVRNIKSTPKGICQQYDYVLYVGRGREPVGSTNVHLGNPFTVQQYGRDEALNQYKLWLGTEHSANYRNMLDKVKARLIELETAKQQELSVLLLCWCAPNPCHADIIKDYLLE